MIIIASACLSLSSCTQCSTSTTDEEEPTYKSQSYKLVEKHINEMATNPWDKSVYLEIRDKQISMLKKNSERMSASTLLETEYSKLLVRDANTILHSGCVASNSHSLFKSLFDELKAYPQVPGLDDIKTLKKLHDDAESFTQTAVGRQSVSSYRTSYDKSHETTKMAEAKKFLGNSKIKCIAIRKKMENLSQSSAYESRRKAYCQSVVSFYLQCTNPAKSELNAAKANLGVYNGDTSSWKEQLEEHYKELNKKDDE